MKDGEELGEVKQAKCPCRQVERIDFPYHANALAFADFGGTKIQCRWTDQRKRSDRSQATTFCTITSFPRSFV